MGKKMFFVLVAILALFCQPVSASFSKGLTAYEEGRYEAAIKAFRDCCQ